MRYLWTTRITAAGRDINFELQHCSGFIEALQWSFIGKSFSWASVEFVSDLVALSLSQSRHAASFGQVLADQAIGVLVGRPLPRVVGRGEVENCGCAFLDGGVVVKFGAVVGGDGFDGAGVFSDDVDRSGIQSLRGSIGQLADAQQAGFALHEAHDAILGAGAHHGIDFPVARVVAAFELRGAL